MESRLHPKQRTAVVDFDDYPRDRKDIVHYCSDLIHTYETADVAWNSMWPHRPWGDESSLAPDLWRAMVSGKRSVDAGSGVLVLRETHVERCEGEVAQLLSLFISTAFGIPTKTDKRLQRFAWPVRYEKSNLRSPTFSQTMDEAAFHTDSQYLDEPERYFGLFCMASDVRGQGTNFLVSRSHVVEKLMESYPAALDHIRSTFPFRVPSVFTAGASDKDVEVVWAPILEEDSIRFRRDTIASALKVPGVKVTGAQLAALEALDRAISEIAPFEHHLEPGEALIVDNHSMLHSRSPFRDTNRLLYRVRMKHEDPLLKPSGSS